MNISSIKSLSDLFQAIGSIPRLEILLAIGAGEACVCHLEASLGYRQAYISQHLMALRDAGILSTRRDGKYIFYRLEKSEIMGVLEMAARLADYDISTITNKVNQAKSMCDCPNCSTQME